MSNPKLHTDTKCRVIKLADMKFEFESSEPMHTFKVILPDGIMILPNFCDYWQMFKNSPGFHYFLIDSMDLANMDKVWEECKTPKEKAVKTEEYLGSMTKFSNFFPKRIYVRLIPPITVGGPEESRVFSDEVMEMIPIAMKQQNTPIPENDARLVNYRLKCAELPFPGTYRTFSVTEFQEILDEFDIDKSLITLIPDPGHEMTRLNYINRGGYIRLFAPDMKPVSDKYQVADHIFTCVVMGVNWAKDKYQRHEKCKQKTKPLIMRCLEALTNVSDFWMECDKQFQFIEWIRTQCAFTHQSTNAQFPDYLMDRFPAEAEIDIDNYNMVVDHFNLVDIVSMFPSFSKNRRVPVWKHRLFCKLGWIQQFFNEKDNQDVKNMMIECLYFMVPEQHTAVTKNLVNNVITGTYSELATERTLKNPDEEATAKMLAAQTKRNAVLQKRKELKKKGKK